MSSRNQPSKKRKKSSAKQPWYVRWFSVLAIIVVASLVFGTLGIAVFDDWFNDNDSDSDIVVNPGTVSEVERRLLAAVDENPDDFSAMSALGEYYYTQGRFDESIRWYERALMLVPADMDIRYSFANSLNNAGKLRDAELQYLKVIEAEPQNNDAMLGLARLYRSWSPPRNAEAAGIYQKIIDSAEGTTGNDVPIVVQLALEELSEMGATPVASPAASPVASPAP